MSMYYVTPRSDDLVHFGIKRRSGRYPYGSGERPYQDLEAAKAERREKRKATMKKIASGLGKAAWTGVAVSLKVVASSAITSATIAGIATAGFQFLQSPAAQQMMNRIGVAAGNFVYANFVAPAANQAARNIDSAIGAAMNAVGAIDPGTPNLSSITTGTQYIPKILSSDVGQRVIKELTKS